MEKLDVMDEPEEEDGVITGQDFGEIYDQMFDPNSGTDMGNLGTFIGTKKLQLANNTVVVSDVEMMWLNAAIHTINNFITKMCNEPNLNINLMEEYVKILQLSISTKKELMNEVPFFNQ